MAYRSSSKSPGEATKIRKPLTSRGIAPFYSQRPQVAVVNTYNEMHPGHIHLRTLAEQGAVIKQVAVKESFRHFVGKARVFNCEEEALLAPGSKQIDKGDIIVIRYEGPKGGPGMREMAMFRVALELAGLGETNYIVTDGRFSGYTEGASIGYLSPEAAEGGTIALVQNGDTIEIDIENRKLDLKVSDQELKKRKEKLVPSPKKYPRGYLDIYGKIVSSAAQGAVIPKNAK
jgi:dihydroxy-acid dehydratase